MVIFLSTIIFVDFFRGEQINKVNLSGLQCILSFTAAEGKIYMRVFK